MAHLDVDAAVGRGAARPHFRVDGAAHHVARRAFDVRIVIAHETRHGAVEEIAARAAQAFLQHRAGHARVGAGEQAGRVELHHLHVAQRQAEPQRHGDAVHALVARRRVVAIHRRAAAGREQHRVGRDEVQRAAADVGEQHAGERAAVARGDEGERAMLLQPGDAGACPHLLHQAVDDLDAGEVALVDGAVEGLAGERLATCRAAVEVAVEEAADLVLEARAPARPRASTWRPGELTWWGSHLPPSMVSMKCRSIEGRPCGARRCSRPGPCGCIRICRAIPWWRRRRRGRGRRGAHAAPRTARRRRSRGSGCRWSNARSSWDGISTAFPAQILSAKRRPDRARNPSDAGNQPGNSGAARSAEPGIHNPGSTRASPGQWSWILVPAEPVIGPAEARPVSQRNDAAESTRRYPGREFPRHRQSLAAQ